MIAVAYPKRVLLVTYAFPPTGGAGVQRAAKFVKYLPEQGWQPSILTVSNPSVPLVDESLLSDIPAGTVIRTARTFEPGYGVKQLVSGSHEGTQRRPGLLRRALKGLARAAGNALLQPDPQILWLPAAVRAGTRLLAEIPHDAIVATAPPFSSLLVGAILSRRSGLPLVLDYRDEWDISNAYWENKRQGIISRWVQSGMQRYAVRTARALVATTRASARSLAAIAARSRSAAQITHIYNGYDPDDFFADPAPREERDRFRLAYIGTLWNLTSVGPLVEGVQKLAAHAPHLAERLELVFAGRRTGQQDELLNRLEGLPCRVVRLPYVDHHEAIDLMRTADALCLLLSDLPHGERVVSAKVFEYMAARRPILAIAPRGEHWDLLRDCPAARCHTPGDTEGIAKSLAGEMERALRDEPFDAGDWDASRFDRRHLAGELAELLDELLDNPPGDPGVSAPGLYGSTERFPVLTCHSS